MQIHNLNQPEGNLWDAADELLANFKMIFIKYCLHVLARIFLRYATKCYRVVCQQIEEAQTIGRIRRTVHIPEATALLNNPIGLFT